LNPGVTCELRAGSLKEPARKGKSATRGVRKRGGKIRKREKEE
jgi:hypothetical protein